MAEVLENKFLITVYVVLVHAVSFNIWKLFLKFQLCDKYWTKSWESETNVTGFCLQSSHMQAVIASSVRDASRVLFVILSPC